MARQDIRLEDNDLFIIDGDLQINESDQQHVLDLIGSYLGHWKQFPLIGVGSSFFLKSPGRMQELRAETSRQLRGDGYRLNRIDLIDEQIYIDAELI